MRQKTLLPRGFLVVSHTFISLPKRCIDAYTGYAVRENAGAGVRDLPEAFHKRAKLVFETFHKFYSAELVPEVGLCAPGPLHELATNGGPLQEPLSVMEALLDVDELILKNARYTEDFRATFPQLCATVGRDWLHRAGDLHCGEKTSVVY